MYHLDIPKTRQYDTGKIEVIARSSVGETLETCELNVIPRSDDYRNVLKNSPRRKCLLNCTRYEVVDLRILMHTVAKVNSIITKQTNKSIYIDEKPTLSSIKRVFLWATAKPNITLLLFYTKKKTKLIGEGFIIALR